jgi:hypothetical protein
MAARDLLRLGIQEVAVMLVGPGVLLEAQFGGLATVQTGIQT